MPVPISDLDRGINAFAQNKIEIRCDIYRALLLTPPLSLYRALRYPLLRAWCVWLR
jgi:hypothetical protein